METESYERSSQGKVGRVGTRAGAADRHMIAPQKICEMLNGFVTFTQYFVTKLSTLYSLLCCKESVECCE